MEEAKLGLFAFYDLVKGPFFVMAFLVFALGLAWRLLTFSRLTVGRPRRLVRSTRFMGAADDDALLFAGRSPLARLRFHALRVWRGSVFAANPLMAPLSLAFHLLVCILPLAVPAHNILLFMRFRVALPSFPEAAADVLCVLCLAILLGFLARRLILPRVRALSDAGDLVVILLVAAPFASAWLAYHQAFNYRDILIAHMLLGELLIAALPFTKLGHLPFLLYARLFMAGEGGARRAARGWAR